MLILTSAITGCFSICSFAYLLGIPIGISFFVIGLKLCATAVESRKYRSMINKKCMLK